MGVSVLTNCRDETGTSPDEQTAVGPQTLCDAGGIFTPQLKQDLLGLEISNYKTTALTLSGWLRVRIVCRLASRHYQWVSDIAIDCPL